MRERKGLVGDGEWVSLSGTNEWKFTIHEVRLSFGNSHRHSMRIQKLPTLLTSLFEDIRNSN